jgi:hypothetical protein
VEESEFCKEEITTLSVDVESFGFMEGFTISFFELLHLGEDMDLEKILWIVVRFGDGVRAPLVLGEDDLIFG